MAVNTLPEFFKIPGDNVVNSYNFADVATNTGYIEFNLGRTIDGLVMNNSTFESAYIVTRNSTGGSTFAKIIDIDFDVEVAKPIDLKGLAIINCSSRVEGNAGGTGWGYVIVRLRKWDGVTETEIAVSSASTTQSSTTSVYDTIGHSLTVPLTHYKAGEYIRLTIEGWFKETGGGTGSMAVSHDPAKRIVGFSEDNDAITWDANYPTNATFLCPVKIDL